MSFRAKFQDQTVPLTSSFVLMPFGFKADNWMLINDETLTSYEIEWSYDGVEVHGKIKPSEAVSYDTADVNGVYLRYANGAPAYRLIAHGAL